MSNRKKGLKDFSTNPATKFIEWKSNDKKFSYYDKEKSENVFLELPFKFLFLEDLHTVKGWHDPSESGIFSNEVLFISSQEMKVKAFKGGELATGLYKDIKDKVKSLGGHYVRSVYVMLEDGSIAKLQMKGSAVQSFGEFFNKNKQRVKDEWISVKTFREGKKGSIKYTVPEFIFDKSLSVSEELQADKCFDALEEYLKNYQKKEEPIIEDEEHVDVSDF